MDILLPDEGTMELMREKFESLDIGGRARAATGAIAACMTDTYCKTDVENAQNSRRLHKIGIFDADGTPSDEADMTGDVHYIGSENVDVPNEKSLANRDGHALIRTAKGQDRVLLPLLYLYFIKVLGYNSRYGTQIYDAQRGLGGLQSIARPFGELNGLV